MNFSTKKRPRKDAWKELQSELDEREKLEEENSAKQRRLDALRARACIEEDPTPAARHCYMDFEIGRQMGRDPQITRGRLVVELFHDLMPRTVGRFVELLESQHEPTYRQPRQPWGPGPAPRPQLWPCISALTLAAPIPAPEPGPRPPRAELPQGVAGVKDHAGRLHGGRREG